MQLETKIRKPQRTLSGIAIVAVMTSPHRCKHGKCIYCPSVKGIPESYVDNEPTVMRAKALNFDAKKQVEKRLEQLSNIEGHCTDKVEIIVMGGTFTERSFDYQYSFIKGCFDGLNGFVSNCLEEAHMHNETAKHRCVGLTVETRPDRIDLKTLENLLGFGVTRVEIGVQIPDNKIYEITKRGHSTKDVIRATKLLRNAGLKICYHYMPNLPGSNPRKDLYYFRRLFRDRNFKPDMLKIYPTVVVKNTELYEMWKRGEYEPYDEETLIELLVKMKKCIPEWVRVMRLFRDIPSNRIVAGCKKTNLREIVLSRVRCRCIRCREIGRTQERGEIWFKAIKYRANNGKEMFMQVLCGSAVIGLLRLWLPAHRNYGIVRELRVFGKVAPLGTKLKDAVQHRGYGKYLMKKAEEFCMDYGRDVILVRSAVGTRRYYMRLGYDLRGFYMRKDL